MAGSYEHVTHGWSSIETMGDAYEAVEEMLWLIQREIGEERAKRLIEEELYPISRGEKPLDSAVRYVESKMSK